MKIALEASNIGQGRFDSSGRTGVYRVATSLSEALLKRKDIELFFSFLALPHTAELARRFFEEHGHSVRLLCDSSDIEKKLYKFLLDIPNLKHKYGIMLYASKFFNLLNKKKFPSSIDIFHSIYYPLPSAINPRKHVRFITIHDIIAVLFPQFCKNVHIKSVHNALNSINKNHDWVITVSQSTKNDLCGYTGIQEEKVFVSHLAASPALYYPFKDTEKQISIIQKLNIPEDDYFLSLATLEPRKNLEFALRCFKKVITEPDCNHVNFVLAGNKGWKIDPLYTLVQNDPILKKNVIFTGYIPDQYLSPVYSGALAFIYPSMYEGFGLPPLEAMQCGTPVITSNTSSLPEVVGDTGLLVDPHDESALCQAMVDMVKNKRLRDELSIKGIQRAQLFSWDKCADETIKAYRFAFDNKLI